MNTKQAKKIRRRAKELMKALGVKKEEDAPDYEQVLNCVSWERAINKDGSLMRDEDGNTLLAPVKNPGTIQCKIPEEVFYRFLKRLYKKGESDAKTIMEGSEKDLLDLFDKS